MKEGSKEQRGSGGASGVQNERDAKQPIRGREREGAIVAYCYRGRGGSVAGGMKRGCLSRRLTGARGWRADGGRPRAGSSSAGSNSRVGLLAGHRFWLFKERSKAGGATGHPANGQGRPGAPMPVRCTAANLGQWGRLAPAASPSTYTPACWPSGPAATGTGAGAGGCWPSPAAAAAAAAASAASCCAWCASMFSTLATMCLP